MNARREAVRRAATLVAAAALAALSSARAVESDPLPVPVGSARERSVAVYNEGVALLVSQRYADAKAKFESAIALDEAFPEAHNNLAFSLRMLGPAHFASALRHYDRAIGLRADFARAYMYRGVLYTQMGDRASAKADLWRLRTLDAALAAELEVVIAGGSPGYARAGIAPQRD